MKTAAIIVGIAGVTLLIAGAITGAPILLPGILFIACSGLAGMLICLDQSTRPRTRPQTH